MKYFSRLLVDLTLDQKINSDIAYQGHFIRTSIISQFFEVLDFTVKEYVSQDLKPSQISQNSTHFAKLIEMIELTMNPISCYIEKKFFI